MVFGFQTPSGACFAAATLTHPPRSTVDGHRGADPLTSGFRPGRVPAELIAKEKEIAAEQVKNKPPQAIAKIVEGKLEKFYQGYCLVDQGFVKKNSEITVKEHVAAVSKQLGDEITVRHFVRFQVGESITG